jgi:WD40 repeat protein/tRNA A-37 threonylcarbamoyl transferase component Bud32
MKSDIRNSGHDSGSGEIPPESPEMCTCPTCKTPLSADVLGRFCLVCMLRGAIDETVEFAEEDFAVSTPVDVSSEYGFEHYELVKGEDGKPIELGRGAMAVTYKAFDVDLRCTVTLKVISERYLGDESARLRFLREARAAASLRHPNVASVFHLGRSGGNYFYAMEFVEGETLAHLIKHSGPLEVKLALEITNQVAAGLAAVHKKNLVHRDIKPSNIMVSLEDGDSVTAKIIDLGLAKAVEEPYPEAGISTPGAFTGTPHYASPEQCAGKQTDIRSDLYSLGITLWQMLTCSLPFNGGPVEVMGQHLRAPLPFKQLEHLQRPVVVLIRSLLDKDPARRPQSPSDLKTLLTEVREALGTKGKAKSRCFVRTAAKHSRGEVLHRRRLDGMSAAKEARRGEARGHARGLLLEPWDFTPFLVEKIKGFTGREWLFQEIDEWRARGSSAVLLIAGQTGVGKSAIVSALVHRNPGGQVLGYHCCRADTPATLEPAVFVRSLAAMLAARLEDYAAMLGGSFIADTLRRSDTDPISAFEAAILGPLHKIMAPEGDRCYLLIDSLDEALTRVHRPTIVDALSTRLDRLPSWLGIVATTRNDPEVLSQLGGLRARILSAQDPRNQDDVRRFIRNRLAQPILRDQARGSSRMLAGLEKDLLRSSAGNFLFVTTALNAVESGQLSFDQIEKLPPGLSSLYMIFFHRLFRDASVDFGVARRILETMAAARESLNREQIAAASGLDAKEDLPLILSRLASFVPASEGRYAFFHKSLSDWLTGWDNRQDQPFAGPYHLNLEKGSMRLANWCWAEYQRGSLNIASYCLRHLPVHLHQVGRDDALRNVLSDFNFLQRKLEATDARALIADYEYLPEGSDLRLVHSAVRLSAHVLARDKRQLAGQLTGRLLSNPTPIIQVLLRGAAESKSGTWLQPLTPSLAPPGGPMIRTFEGHTAWIHAVVLTPDGNCAISGSWDGTLRVWDLESGQSIRTLEGHTGWVNAVAVTPDGERAISASSDRTLRVWDLESGQSVCTMEAHKDRVNAVAVTPDGERAISASSDRTLRVWDLGSGQLVRTLQGHTDGVNAVVPTPDGRHAITGSADHSLSVWDLESGQLVRTLEGHTHSVTTVVLMPDECQVISGSADHTLRMWDLEKGQLLRTLEGHTDWVTAVVVTPDGRRAISGSADRTLRMWDLEVGQSAHTLAGYADSVTAVALGPDGRPVAFVSEYQVLHLWDLESGQLLCALEGHEDWITAVAVTLDGRRAVSASADHTLRLWDLESGRSVHTLAGHTDLVSAVAVTPDGRHAISASSDHTLRLWNLESGQALRTLASYSNLVSSLAVTPDGCRAVWGSNAGALLVWSSDSGDVVRILAGHKDWVTAVGITPDGSRAISASADNTLRMWDLESCQSVHTLAGHTGLVNAVALTPDGRCAVSASADYTLRVWDIESGIHIATFTGESPMLRCAIAPDGRTIIAREKSGRGHFLRLKGLD